VLLLETPLLLVTSFSFLKFIVRIKCLFSLFLLFYVHFNDRLLKRNFFKHFLIIFIEENLKISRKRLTHVMPTLPALDVWIHASAGW